MGCCFVSRHIHPPPVSIHLSSPRLYRQARAKETEAAKTEAALVQAKAKADGRRIYEAFAAARRASNNR